MINKRVKKDILFELISYVNRILGDDVKIRKKSDISMVPLYLQEIFKFYELKLYGEDLVAVIYVSTKFLHTPAKIRKFIDTLKGIFSRDIVFISNGISSWNRDRLIKQKVSFIIPENQMFLPNIGIDLREHFKQKRDKVEYFSPSTQSIIIGLILKKLTYGITPDEIVRISGYSRMTITRVIDELETLGILNVNFQGKESFIDIKYSGKELWKEILPYLRTPIKKTLYLKEYDNRFDEHFFVSGFSALSEYTMLSGADIFEYAISKSLFNDFCRKGYFCDEVKYPEEAKIRLELWNYVPGIAGDKMKQVVDRISLYKCFDDTEDERVLQALDELLRGIKW